MVGPPTYRSRWPVQTFGLCHRDLSCAEAGVSSAPAAGAGDGTLYDATAGSVSTGAGFLDPFAPWSRSEPAQIAPKPKNGTVALIDGFDQVQFCLVYDAM